MPIGPKPKAKIIVITTVNVTAQAATTAMTSFKESFSIYKGETS